MKMKGHTADSCAFYSVILPVYNERENLERLIAEISTALIPLAGDGFEIIAVDDRSSDGSLEKLKFIAEHNPHVQLLAHSWNCGQSAALATGINNARGDIIITMDADGQNNPADIGMLIDALKPGVDAICGIRKGRQDTWVRKVSSRVANRFRNWITGDTIQDAGCTFRVIRKHALDELPVFNGLHRFLPSLFRMKGYVVREVCVSHRPRTWGASKYGIRNRLGRGLIDCFAMRWWKNRIIPGRRLADA